MQSRGPYVQLARWSPGPTGEVVAARTRAGPECRSCDSWLRSPRTVTSLPRLRVADPAFHLLGDVAQTARAPVVSRGRSIRSSSARCRRRPSSAADRGRKRQQARSSSSSSRRRGPRARPATSSLRTLSTRRAQQAVTLVASCCGGSTPPVRTRSPEHRGRSSTGRAPRLQRGRCRFDSDRLHLQAFVVSTASTRPLFRPRCGFDSCRRLFSTPRSSVDRALPCEGRGRWFDSSRAYLNSRT